MRNLGLVFGRLSLSTGIAASVVFGLNLLVWSIMAALLGSATGYLGFALIVLALHPKAIAAVREFTEDDEAIEIDFELGFAKAA